MLSMEPSIKRGLTIWDRALMPLDEFEERVRLVRAAMRRGGLAALLVAGNMYEDADLIYLVGGAVDGMLVLTAGEQDEPAIFTNSGSREGFFLRQLTWIDQLSYAGSLVGKAVAAALASRGVTAGRIGTVGLQVLTRRQYDDITGALPGFELQDFGPDFGAIRAQPRPREVAAMRRALGMAEKAAAAAAGVFAAGGSNASAIIEAERVARRAGSWDFRALANLYADDLRPFERPSDSRRAPLLLWLATRYQGYWADRTVSSGGHGEADAAVAAMARAACAGASAGAVAAAGLATLSEPARASALAHGLGHGIGAELNGAPEIRPDNPALLQPGMLLSFRVFARGTTASSIASALVQVGTDGAQPLEPG